MPRMIFSILGVDMREVAIADGRTTLGRRPTNDIVIDNLAISGQHAALHCTGNVVLLEDLQSTNGTYVNGRAIQKQVLRDADVIELGKYKLRYIADAAPPAPAAAPVRAGASIRVIAGTGSGSEVPLQKVVTTFGKPGVAVAVVTRRLHGYLLSRIDGGTLLNGEPLGGDPVLLRDGDVMELAELRLQFVG